MKSHDPLDNAFAKLAGDTAATPDLEDFKSGVWREIRHREALCAHAEPASWWLPLLDLRVTAAAACLALLIGVFSGVVQSPTASTPSPALQHLDLAIFSSSASGLPSNALASRK